MGVGETGQIIGETGVGEMGVGEMGVNIQTVKELKSEETLQFAKIVMGALYQNSKFSK